MKFEDDTQNLKARMAIIHGLVIAILAVLGARLYFLQVVNGDYYAERAENQRVRRLRIPAPRGAIFDRNGKLLVDSRSTYNIILSGEDMKGKDLGELVEPLSQGLDVAPDILREHFEQAGHQAAFEEVTVKESATPADLAWVDAHTLEFPMLLVREQPQRRYPENGVLAHVLGYVGEISPEQLKQPKFKDYADNPYHSGDIVGQEGLEATYDRYLRGKDGYREVEAAVVERQRFRARLDNFEPALSRHVEEICRDVHSHCRPAEGFQKCSDEPGPATDLDASPRTRAGEPPNDLAFGVAQARTERLVPLGKAVVPSGRHGADASLGLPGCP